MEPSIIKALFAGKDPTTFDLETVAHVLEYVRNVLVALAAAEAIFSMIAVAWKYVTAYGDEAKAADAKKTLYWAIVGMIIIIFSEVIVYEAERVVIDAAKTRPAAVPQVFDPLTNPITPH